MSKACSSSTELYTIYLSLQNHPPFKFVVIFHSGFSEQGTMWPKRLILQHECAPSHTAFTYSDIWIKKLCTHWFAPVWPFLWSRNYTASLKSLILEHLKIYSKQCVDITERFWETISSHVSRHGRIPELCIYGQRWILHGNNTHQK